MAGIGIISNPHSRRNRRYPEEMRRLAYVLGKDDVADTTRSAEDIRKVAARFREAEIDVLALNGGDGTNHVTLTQFVDVYGDKPLPLIALLRGGTMNTVSNGIGIAGRPNALLVNIVEKYQLKQPFETSERDLLKVTDERTTSYGFLFGTGLISNFLEAYYGTGRPSPLTAARLLARGVGSIVVRGPLARRLIRPMQARLEADGGPWLDEAFSAVLASTVEQIGLGFRPFIRCEAQPHTFHALAIRCGPTDLLPLLPQIRLGRPLPQHKVADKVARRLVIESEEPLGYTVDGELHEGGKRVILETGPRVKIIVK
jgi:diacylglycerol kinase (ATP)